MKIDCSREMSKDKVLTDFTIEAALFDAGVWYNHDGNVDLLSSNVANIVLKTVPTGTLGFHGYVLVGKLEKPKLWSAEQVRFLVNQNYFKLILLYLFIKLKRHWHSSFPFSIWLASLDPLGFSTSFGGSQKGWGSKSVERGCAVNACFSSHFLMPYGDSIS